MDAIHEQPCSKHGWPWSNRDPGAGELYCLQKVRANTAKEINTIEQEEAGIRRRRLLKSFCVATRSRT